MIICGEGCTPVCDFCKYCVHRMEFDLRYFFKHGLIHGEPLRCRHPQHKDDKKIFWGGAGYCDDFHCFMAKGKKGIVK